jgi:hypothetical protein
MPTADRDTLDGLLPGVSDAVDAYDANIIDVQLDIAADTVGDPDFWGASLEVAEALITLHLLATSGALAQAAVEDPGEVGVETTRSITSTAHALAADEFGSSRWGRQYHALQRRKLAVTLSPVVGTTQDY